MAFNIDKVFSKYSLTAKQVMVLISKLAVVFFIICAFLLIILNRFSGDSIEQNKLATVSTLSPVSDAFRGVGSFLNNFMENLATVLKAFTYKAEIQKLHEQNFKLLIKLHDYKLENSALKTKLNYLNELKYNTSVARVVSRSPGPYVESAYIRAEKQGDLQIQKAVLNEDGLVGQIKKIDGKDANILLVTSLDSNVPVKTRNTNIRAILVGNGTKNPRLDYIVSTKKVTLGEEILTSGDGGVFPPDVPVGYVEKIKDDQIVVETFVDWSSLDYVYVLK